MDDELTKMFDKSMMLEQRSVAVPSSAPSISQHYHHSAHLLNPKASAQNSKGELSDSDAIQLLAQNGIEAVHLSFSQAALFKKADFKQRDRLIELWNISPPQPSDWQGSGGPRETCVQMEENLAKERYACSSHQVFEAETVAEPYISTIYKDGPGSTYSPYGSAVGSMMPPVGQTNGAEWWKDFVGGQPMELQYGLLEYMHNQPSARNAMVSGDPDMH